jgi:predicted permease
VPHTIAPPTQNNQSCSGALGFTPLDFILPVLLFLAARKTPVWWKVINLFLAVAYTVVGVLGSVGAFYFIAQNISKYKVRELSAACVDCRCSCIQCLPGCWPGWSSRKC